MSLAQNRMKQHADSNRTEREFAIGDYVYLKLHPYHQKSLLKRPSHKLSPRYYDPFKILEHIGKVAYKLQLPPQCKIHPTFHVSLLKKHVGDTLTVSPTLPPMDNSGSILWTPAKVLDIAIVRRKKRSVTQWFIQWEGLSKEDST